MKKVLAIILALVMVLGLAACGGSKAPAKEEGTTLTLWTYPIGNWGDEASVNALMDQFKADTGITVNVEYLTYADGDDKVNTAITAKGTPDLIMEGPERLVANWGANGYMVDMSDILTDADKAEINPAALSACVTADGKVYEYPVVMTAHCMAVNLDAFKAAGVDQYVNAETHTWTTADFKAAVEGLYKYYGDTVAAVFCGGQGGDQGTRAIINNLYGGTFTTADHTAYTWDDPANVKALEELAAMDGIYFDPSIVGGDEINLFRQGILKMAFCWNIAQQLNTTNNAAGLTDAGDEIVFMSFPAEDGVAALCGGIWGFGIFDNGDAAKIDAAKQFVKYFGASEHTVDAVKTASYFAVRDAVEGKDISGIWADNEIMNEYNVLMQYLGDYYQVTTGWANARTQWWTMLQAINAGTPAADAVAQYNAIANAK